MKQKAKILSYRSNPAFISYDRFHQLLHLDIFIVIYNFRTVTLNKYLLICLFVHSDITDHVLNVVGISLVTHTIPWWITVSSEALTLKTPD